MAVDLERNNDTLKENVGVFGVPVSVHCLCIVRELKREHLQGQALVLSG